MLTRSNDAEVPQNAAIMKRLTIWILALALMAPAASAATALDEFLAGVHKTTLPNGLTLLVRETPGSGAVTVNTWVKAGYFHEPDEVAGMAHLFEHMLFKGSKKFPSAEDLDRALASVGGRSNAGTIYDVTNYYYMVPREGLRRAMEVQADAIAQPLFDPAELKKESEVVIEESNRKYDNAPAVSFERMLATAFEKHRIKRWRIGSNEVLRNINHDNLYAFFQTLYRPENMVLVVAGDVKYDDVVRLAKETFGTIPKGTLKKQGGPAEPAQKEFRYGTSSADVRQGYTVIGWHTPGVNNADELTLDLLATVLGGGRSSRLFRQVVGPDGASTADAQHMTFEDVGIFSVSASFDEKNRAEVDRRLLAEVERIKKNGPSEFELQLAKNLIESGRLLNLEDALGQAQALGEAEVRGGYKTMATNLAKLQSITSAQIADAARRYLTTANMTLYHYTPKGVPAMTREAALAFVNDAVKATPRPLELASTAPAAPAPVKPAAKATAPQTLTLSNGATLLVEERPGAPVVTAAVLFRGGRSEEDSANAGITQLLMRTMRRGTTTRTAAQVDQQIEYLGAEVAPMVQADYFGMRVTSTARAFRPAAALVADLVLNPAFPEDGLREEKHLQKGAIKRAADSATARPMQLLAETVFRNHPYALPLDGYASSVDAIDAAALRAWWQRALDAKGTLVVIAGDIAKDDAVAVAESLFGRIPKNDAPKAAALVPMMPATKTEAVEYRDKKQSAIAIGFPAVPITSPDWVRLRLLQEIASGGNPLLMNELRGKRSLAYTVFGGVSSAAQAGMFQAYIGTEARKENEAREGLVAELRRMAKDAVTDESLALAKSSLAGAAALSMQTNVAHVYDLARNWFYGLGLDFTSRYVAEASKLSLDDVRKTAEQYLGQENYAVAIVRGKS
jgi:zinc protease